MGGRGTSSGFGWQSQLRQAAKQGKMPTALMGSRDVQRQMFEMIDKLYPMPSQANVLQAVDQGDAYWVRFKDSTTRRSSFPSGNAANAAEKNGVLKWLIWNKG